MEVRQNEQLGKRVQLKDNIMKVFSFSTILILIILFTTMQDNFLGKANLKTLLSDSAPLIIMAAGMTSIILLGSIDLSMGAACSVANVIVVKIINGLGPSIQSSVVVGIIAFFSAILFGAFSGSLLGIVHVKFKVPSFIASLGFMSLWQSVALLITDAPVSILKPMWGTIEWFKITFGVIGLPLVLALIWVVVIYLIQSKTKLGREVYAIGGNERCSRVAGVNVGKAKIIVFAVNGICAAMGGFFLAAKLRSSAPTVGDPFTLLIVASVALGGTALSGGRGGVLGTLLGVFTVSIIQNGMNFIGIDAYWQNIVFGIFVLFAVAISTNRSVKGLVVK